MCTKAIGKYSKDLENEAYAYISKDIKDVDTKKLFNDFKCFIILKTRELFKLKNYEARIENIRSMDVIAPVNGKEEIVYYLDITLSIIGNNNCPLKFPICGMFDDDENVIIIFGNKSISYYTVRALIENENLTYAELNQKRFDPEE